MARYIYVLKSDVDKTVRFLSRLQGSNGIFHNIVVLPYRGKALDPAQYVTIKIG